MDKRKCSFTGFINAQGEQAAKYCNSDSFYPLLAWPTDGIVFSSKHSDDMNCFNQKSTFSLLKQNSKEQRMGVKTNIITTARRHEEGYLKLTLNKFRIEKYLLIAQLKLSHWEVEYDVECSIIANKKVDNDYTDCKPTDMCLLRDAAHNITWLSPYGFYEFGGKQTKLKWINVKLGITYPASCKFHKCPVIRYEGLLSPLSMKQHRIINYYIDKVAGNGNIFDVGCTGIVKGRRVIEAIRGVSIGVPINQDAITVPDERKPFVTIKRCPLIIFSVMVITNLIFILVVWFKI